MIMASSRSDIGGNFGAAGFAAGAGGGAAGAGAGAGGAGVQGGRVRAAEHAGPAAEGRHMMALARIVLLGADRQRQFQLTESML